MTTKVNIHTTKHRIDSSLTKDFIISPKVITLIADKKVNYNIIEFFTDHMEL